MNDTMIPRGRPPLAHDLLQGADAIAEFLFGDRNCRRRVYHLATLKRNRLPVAHLGSKLCARRSTLMEWIEEQEARAGTGVDELPADLPPELR